MQNNRAVSGALKVEEQSGGVSSQKLHAHENNEITHLLQRSILGNDSTK